MPRCEAGVRLARLRFPMEGCSDFSYGRAVMLQERFCVKAHVVAAPGGRLLASSRMLTSRRSGRRLLRDLQRVVQGRRGMRVALNEHSDTELTCLFMY